MKVLLWCAATVIAALTYYIPQSHTAHTPTILVFTKTAGYRHSSIDTAVVAIRALGKVNGFEVESTSNTTAFTESNLDKYAAVIFLHTTGNLLNVQQEVDFERYIQSGGGFVG